MERLQETQAKIERRFGSQPSFFLVATDVSDADQVASLFAVLQDRYGRLDLLFSNASRGNPSGSFLDWSAQQSQDIVGTNINSMFYCLQQAFRLMSKQSPRGGLIINNGSPAAHSPRPNSAVYTATKHAVTGLTKAASLDGRQYDIAVGQIDIGNAMSELAGRMANGVPQAKGDISAEPLIGTELVG